MLAEWTTVAVLLSGGTVPTPPPLHVELPSAGARYGQVAIPKIGIRVPIRQGVAHDAVLSRGVGHERSSYGPGMGGTILLFGHRVTPVLGLGHGPFRFINRLRRGNRIVVTMPYGRFVYRVLRHRVLTPAQVARRFRPSLERERLVLTACHPPGSREFRYVVIARRQK
jgi:sortase A